MVCVVLYVTWIKELRKLRGSPEFTKFNNFLAWVQNLALVKNVMLVRTKNLVLLIKLIAQKGRRGENLIA